MFAPIKCSVQIDTLGRDCINTGDGLYQYKGIVDVPALAMVDDIIGVTTCCDETVELNSIINAKIEAKKLRLSETKCYKIHISKKQKVCSIRIKAHENDIKEVASAVYLGDVINEDGSIDDTVKDRVDKSIGKTSQVMSILSGVSLGMFHMDIALTLRESIFLNGILTNSETWYNMSEVHINLLEDKDNELMRKIFNAHSKTALELFWLETGKISIRYYVSKRRLMFLWNILKQNNEQLIRKTYNAQKLKTTKGDWYEMIQTEKVKYSIIETDEEISQMSRYRFKRIVDKKINYYAFENLKVKAAGHSKSLNILATVKNQKVGKRKSYLRENTLSRDDCQLLFRLRTKMLDVKTNFSNQFEKILTCRTCKKPDSIEDEDHLLKCDRLISENNHPEVNFDYVFKDLDKQILALKVFKSILRKREILLKYQ